MATNSQKTPKLSGWDKVVAWYADKAYTVQMIYSLGASVVIVGALFKILHWPGASYVLMIGMFTEAFLFAIGIFEKPHVTYHWENVFPQLLGEEAVELDINAGGKSSDNKVQQTPVLSDDEMKSLKEGMAGLTKAAAQLTQLTDVATAGNKLTENINSATQAVGAFAQSQSTLSAASKELGNAYQAINKNVESAVADTKEYGQSVADAKDNIAKLNAAYELQLKALQAQAKAVDTITANTATISEALAEGAKAGTQYAQGAKKLAEQINDLNKVYGNMLNALA